MTDRLSDDTVEAITARSNTVPTTTRPPHPASQHPDSDVTRSEVAFALSPEVFLKLIGIGLATAIIVDATIVRMILVPAIMELLGDRAWWAPRWLKRLVPEINIEGEAPRPSAA